jgi:prepilin-type N-terminal cleavage/methylation domain-containing protein
MNRTRLTHPSFRAFTFVELLIVVAIIGVLIIVSIRFTGCGIYESGEAVVKDKYRQLDKYLKDATVLERSNEQLAKAKKQRKELAEKTQKYKVDAEVAKRQTARIEEKIQKSKVAFTSVQEIAKQAGLPKRSEATADDLAKKIMLNGKELTGNDIYGHLKNSKEEVTQCERDAEREKTRVQRYSALAEDIEKALVKMDDDITAIENYIEDYKMYQEMLAAKSIVDLGLNDTQIDQILNSDNNIAELRKKVDELDATITIREKERVIKETLNPNSNSNSITDDDLL